MLIVTDEVKELQTISLQGYYPLSLALAFLPSSEGEGLSFVMNRHLAYFGEAIILAIGGTDRNVHIWTRSDGPLGFTFQLGFKYSFIFLSQTCTSRLTGACFDSFEHCRTHGLV
ncbi:hypothetical protein DEU56DRAFT_81632 [Suillus clintonianus]|uniref:uncharacterized protein n=1 Tax=Suillus clintonianus TaxID=1904413 RepID=UPI001B87C458|nr:uncharacterized protein DEU56DRAFT_81632 [Suillus clintonianus]KAG2148818.1 hypothetical protein DEU56DRAFT_81632 [Suillus clintonianus]